MGVYKDLGTSTVESIDPITGYPKDRYGNLLRTLSEHDGSPVEDWMKPGTKLYNQTNPYGFLYYAVGSGDDFYCFDFTTIDCGPIGEFIILDSTINSETGSFIEGGHYHVLPIRSQAEKREALRTAARMVEDAEDWCANNDLRHSRKGWNQDAKYFLRSVAAKLWSWEFEDFSDREARFGGKGIDATLAKLLT